MRGAGPDIQPTAESGVEREARQVGLKSIRDPPDARRACFNAPDHHQIAPYTTARTLPAGEAERLARTADAQRTVSHARECPQREVLRRAREHKVFCMGGEQERAAGVRVGPAPSRHKHRSLHQDCRQCCSQAPAYHRPRHIRPQHYAAGTAVQAAPAPCGQRPCLASGIKCTKVPALQSQGDWRGDTRRSEGLLRPIAPDGLCGVFSTIRQVRGENAARSAASSRLQAGGASCSSTGVAPASFTIGTSAERGLTWLVAEGAMWPRSGRQEHG